MIFWKDLPATPSIVSALSHAGARPDLDAGQADKRRWSEKFADGCAVAIADLVRENSLSQSKRVEPASLAAGTEPLTPLGTATRKRIDVVVVDALLGLQIGFSLKGLNFRDRTSNNFDKNLTGRLYEMGDEARVVHEHLPHAFLVGVFFLPLESCTDKSPSSYARTIKMLRQRTGRLDVAITGHSSRCDLSFVCLYSHEHSHPAITPGVARLQEVHQDPPKTGRPQVTDTLSLQDAVNAALDKAENIDDVVWGVAEPE